MRGTGNRPPFSYLPKHGGVPWRDAGAVAGQLAGIGAADVRRREEDISEASAQGVRSGGRQRTAGSGVNGSRTRSLKRSGRRERTKASA